MIDTPEFDKSQCTGGIVKGYTGCLCPHCSSYRALKGRWILGLKGNLERGFEISVLRENNRHGIASWGWYGEAKLLVCTAEPDSTNQLVFDELLSAARRIAERMNVEERTPAYF